MASRVARTDGLDCITLEGWHSSLHCVYCYVCWSIVLSYQIVVVLFTGDQVSKKGSMTGGFYDHRRSKLKFMNIIKQNTDSIHIREEELEKVRVDLQNILLC